MNDPAITLTFPFGNEPIKLGFHREAEHDVRLLLRFARARAARRLGGFWLEYGWDSGDSQMVWVGADTMPTATFQCTETPALDERREDDMSARVAEAGHLYFTAEGWQANTMEFADEV